MNRNRCSRSPEYANAARNSKLLSHNVVSSFHTGHIPPGILNYIVAYDGPAHMKTVHGWIDKEYQKLGISLTQLPTDMTKRFKMASDALDAMFVLGRGFLYYDNTPIGFASQQLRQQNPDLKWIFADAASGNLLLLFLGILGATANMEGKWLNPVPYLRDVTLEGVRWGA